MKIKQNIIERLRLITGSRRTMTAAAALGILGMIMILFSGGNSENEEAAENTAEFSAWTDYCSETEMRLEGILSTIDGVGKTKVMVTTGSSEEYIYAVGESASGGREEYEHVILKKGSSEEALVETVRTPVITGVIVVCEGGASDRVCEDVYRAVTASLGIPSTKVHVAQMK